MTVAEQTDKVEKLIAWLRKRGEPNSNISYQAHDPFHDAAYVMVFGSDADFIADHFHGQGARDLADALTELQHRREAEAGKSNYPEIPEGWVMAPREPDDGMMEAGAGSFVFGTPGMALVCYRAMLAAAPKPPSSPASGVRVKATHRHVKRGSKYVLIGYGRMQAENWHHSYPQPGGDGCYCSHHPDDPAHEAECYEAPSVDMREVAIYCSVDDGTLWVRQREEFEDGRFAALSPEVGNDK